jgi:hypothetical protein
MTITERNRLIKKILSHAFGHGNVTVKGSRGTAYGWVSIRINYTPHDLERRKEVTALIWKLFEKAKIEIDTYGYDDPGSDYGYGKKVHINFNQCTYQGPYDRDPARDRVTA